MDDSTLTADVVDELVWGTALEPDNIGVTVHDGAVTLSGYVSTLAEKRAALRAAERVHGVQAVADEIQVRLDDETLVQDPDIAEAILHAFRWNTEVPESVKAEVREGRVTLRGTVDWDHERREAERMVRHIRGVTDVTNMISIAPMMEAGDVEQRVGDALRRSADLDAQSISVTTKDGTVTLHGRAHSFRERRAAENAARATRGVREVHNHIRVTP
jgi:osmotically-inducible protein OsmY